MELSQREMEQLRVISNSDKKQFACRKPILSLIQSDDI